MGKITLYHSELVRSGQVEAYVETDVLNSKYQGKPPYVMLRINGESRRYDTENPDCADAFRGLKGCNVTFEAWSNREQNSAGINILSQQQGGNQPPRQSNPPPAQDNNPQPQPPPQNHNTQSQPPDRSSYQSSSGNAGHRASEDTELEAKKQMNRIAKVYALAYDAGVVVRDAIAEKHGEQMSDAHFQGMVTALYIEGNRKGLHSMMKVGRIYEEGH